MLDVVLGGLAVGKVDWCDFDEMFDLPQASVVLGDVLDDGDVGALEEIMEGLINSYSIIIRFALTHVVIKQSKISENLSLPVGISLHRSYPLDTKKLCWIVDFANFFVFASERRFSFV